MSYACVETKVIDAKMVWGELARSVRLVHLVEPYICPAYQQTSYFQVYGIACGGVLAFECVQHKLEIGSLFCILLV